MAKTLYKSKKFKSETRVMINQAVAICEEYAAQGLVLTLRQLYYQFVARDLLANKQSEYKRLGSVCQDARMAGLMDWDHLIDRTRNLQTYRMWSNPEDAITQAAERYNTDLWASQHQRVEVWIEKDAAIGVIEGVCGRNRVPYFSCRGYTSISEMHVAAQRIGEHIEAGENVTILHIGDHDPSGVDMSRDIEQRLYRFIAIDWIRAHMREQDQSTWTWEGVRQSMWEHMAARGNDHAEDRDPWQIRRIALTIEQIEEYSPPPNPAKETDSRFRKYYEETGMNDSYELDALDPAVLSDLVDDEIDEIRDNERWNEAVNQMEAERTTLERVSAHWESVVTNLPGEVA